MDQAETTPDLEGRRTPWAKRLLIPAKLLLLMAAIYLAARLVAGAGGPEVASRLKTADRLWLTVAALLLLIRFGLWAWRWGLALKRLDRGGPRPVVFFSLVAAAAVNHITPVARVLGGLFRARYTARAGYGTFGRTFGTVFFDQLAHQVVAGSVTLVSLVVAAALLGREGLALAALVALAIAAIGAVWLSRSRGHAGIRALEFFFARRAEAKKGRLGRLFAYGGEAMEVVGRLAADRGLRLSVLALGSCVVGSTTLAQWAVFRALGEPPSLWVVMTGVALGTAAGFLLGTPGGVGGTEAALIACYGALGVPPVEAAAGALLYRALHYAVLLSLGLPALAALELRQGTAGEAEAGSGP